MAGIGSDIASVFSEVGVGYTILRSPTNITGEFLDYDENKKITNTFFLEHEMSVTFSCESQVVPGDKLRFDTDQRLFYVMNINEEIFENAIITKSGILYKCNAVVNLQRLGETGPGYNPTVSWTPVSTGLDVVLSMDDYGARSDLTVNPVEGIARRTYTAWWPLSVQIKREDRVAVQTYSRGIGPSGALNLMIDKFDDWSFRGMTVAYLREDTRVS